MKGMANPNKSHNYYDKNHDEIELYQGNSKRSTYIYIYIMTLNTRTAHTHKKNSPIDRDGVQLTNAQCHMAIISILEYKPAKVDHFVRATMC